MREDANLTYNFARQHDGTESSDQGPVVKNSPFIRDDLFVIKNTETCKFVRAKLRVSFCPAAAKHSRPRQAGA